MFLYLLVLVPVFFVYRWYRETKRVCDEGDKYVFITGCDTGFGNRLARHLDQLGFPVLAGCYTEKGEEELRKNSSARLTTIHVDVSDSKSVSKAAAHIETIVGQKGLWAVVNNAGISLPASPNDWLTVDDFKPMIAVNLLGVIDVTLTVLPLIKKARGRVINIASVFGRVSPFGGPYCVSKYGVEAFNDSLRINMRSFGVKVVCIEPGFFKTTVTDPPLVKNNLTKLWNRLPQAVKDDYGADYATDRVPFCCFLLVTWPAGAEEASICQIPSQNKEPPLTTVPFIRVVLTVVVMVTDPAVGNAAQIIAAKLTLRARSWR